MKYKIERFNKPVIKPYQNVKKYDVALFEYGDYDNWVEAIILNITPQNEGKTLKIDFATTDGRVTECYEFTYGGRANFNIIGTAKEITKEQDIQK